MKERSVWSLTKLQSIESERWVTIDVGRSHKILKNLGAQCSRQSQFLSKNKEQMTTPFPHSQEEGSRCLSPRFHGSDTVHLILTSAATSASWHGNVEWNLAWDDKTMLSLCSHNIVDPMGLRIFSWERRMLMDYPLTGTCSKITAWNEDKFHTYLHPRFVQLCH